MPLGVPAGTSAVALAVELRDERGQVVFRTVGEVAGDVSAATFTVERLPLLGGDYDLAVGAGPVGGDPPTPAPVIGFNVPAVTGAEGVVDLRGSWDVAVGAAR